MKFNRSTLFVIISSVSLVAVLIIQFIWLYQSARYKESFFNEKTTIIKARTTEAITSDPILLANIKNGPNPNDIAKVDSLIRSYMNFYGFREAYSFNIVRETSSNPVRLKFEQQVACSSVTLDSLNNKNGWELQLEFPNKKQFIIAEMGIPFFSSLVLILIVSIFFWRTVSLLIREKRISEHTTEFLNNMTHEFKTPLTNIALAGRMIMKESSDRIKHYSEIILDENEKLRLQVEHVLSMTALEKGEIPLQKTELDIHYLIEDSFKSMQMQIENKRCTVHFYLNAPRFVVMGDKTHLTNTICNLIDNSLKYSNINPEITVETKNEGDILVIFFSDNGIGINKEFRSKIFDKYYRVPTGNLHDVKGFGLGLSYVKAILELHEGNIRIEDGKDGGITFIITLPLE